MWNNMKFICIPIISILLVSLVCSATPESPLTDEREVNVAEVPEQLTLDGLEDGAEQSELPILPPLILLDFINSTNSSSNDEKTKRTVNDNLGYGFQANNLFTGRKVNYYFPSGKSGTTVSIEESISPFLPRTIIERTKPVTEKLEGEAEILGKTLGLRNQHYTTVQPLFGQKMKFRTSSSDSFNLHKFTSTTPATIPTSTQRPVYTTNAPASPYSGFYAPKSLFQQSSSSGLYSTRKTSFTGRITPPSYISTTPTPPLGKTFNRFVPHKMESSTLNPVVSEQFYHPVKTLPPIMQSSFLNEKVVHPRVLNNYPKYTIENGVKYEHKIVWKYPDGRISNDPPNSYINSYSEYESVPRTLSYSMNLASSSQTKDFKNSNYHSNLRYQGPVQFPKDSEVNLPKQTSFVKPAVQINTQRLNNYQYFHNTVPRYSVPKLEVETSNPEYLPPNDESTSKTHAFTSATHTASDVLSKYKTETQNLLNKVLSPPKESYDNDDSDAYTTSSHYANLLNYNPSISQYIKNPASILNAQPTFIQAGNSLIPVIILRVDGAPPVQPKPTPNINLKALLQQYISQYANSVNDLSRGTNYDFEDEQLVSQYQDPHYELKKLTDTLKQISQQSSSPRSSVADSVTDSYGNILSTKFKSLAESRRNSNYRSSYKKPQKVKSVQIVDDA